MTLAPFAQIAEHDGGILALAVQEVNDSSFFVATGGSDYTLNVYQVKEHSISKQWSQRNAHYGLMLVFHIMNSIITAATFGYGENSNLLFTGGYDSVIRVWNCSSGEFIGELKSHKQRINALIASHDGNFIVSASADKTVILWDILELEPIATFSCEEECGCLAMNSEVLVCGYLSGVLRVWPMYNNVNQHLFVKTEETNHFQLDKAQSFRLDLYVCCILCMITDVISSFYNVFLPFHECYRSMTKTNNEGITVFINT